MQPDFLISTIHIVDDNPHHRRFMRHALKNKGGSAATVFEHADLQSLYKHLDASPDRAVILLDDHLVEERGYVAIPGLVSRDIGPILMLTAAGDEELAALSMRVGAADYLVKSHVLENPDLLHQSIRGAIERFQLYQKNRTYEQELLAKNKRLAELYELSTSFVENVSHDFRTPLTVLREFISLMIDGSSGPLGDTQQQYLRMMADKVGDLTIMVNDLLDAGRIEAGLLGVARVPCKLGDIIDSARMEMERSALVNNIKLVFDYPPDAPDIYCDPEKAARVLVNLGINAIKFSPEDSVVRLTAKQAEDESKMEISISDQGPGIPEDSLEEIFERFRQVSCSHAPVKGFGLGLSIAQDLVRLNLGALRVSSELGEGSTFHFTIPKYDPRSLLATYLASLERLGSDSRIISLVSVRIEHSHWRQKHEAADFVNRSLRPFDLFLPDENHNHWFILAATPDPDVIIERLRKDISTSCHAKPGTTSPQLHFEKLGCWASEGNGDEALVESCLKRMKAGQASYAA